MHLKRVWNQSALLKKANFSCTLPQVLQGFHWVSEGNVAFLHEKRKTIMET
jgi:hypothetical protein